MHEEIRSILADVKDGKKVIEYIEELEEHIKHHHGEDCNCGCHDHEDEDEWEEIKSPFKTELTVKDWEKLLKNSSVFDFEALKLVKRMRHIADTTTFAELADNFGFGSVYYSLETEKLAKNLAKMLNVTENGDFTFLFLRYWQNKKTEEKIFSLRSELYEAIGNVDLSGVPLRESEI